MRSLGPPRSSGRNKGNETMKSLITGSWVAMLLLAAAPIVRADVFSVVELTDLRGNKSFAVFSDQDKQKTETDLSAESKAFTKALEETKNEWMRTHAEHPFPNSRLKPRTVRVLSTSMNREEAEKQQLEDKARETRTLANETKEKDRILERKPAHSRRFNNQAAVEQQKRAVREERERDAIANQAERLLREKLAAATGHDIPFYGEASEEPKKTAKRKK